MGFFSKKATCGVCGREVGLNRYKVALSSNALDGHAWCCPDCLKKANKAAGRTLNVWTVTISDIRKFIDPESEVAECDVNTEYRKRCNVCGKVFCYSKSDLNRNIALAKEAKRSATVGAISAIGGTRYDMYEQSKQVDAALNKIVDYSRCPSCNSTDISDLSEEEFKSAMAANNAPASTTVVQQASSADELKKFKELLDAGVITQEEFDAKKKQILGL